LISKLKHSATDLVKDITDAVRRSSLGYKRTERHRVQHSRCKLIVHEVAMSKKVRLQWNQQWSSLTHDTRGYCL